MNFTDFKKHLISVSYTVLYCTVPNHFSWRIRRGRIHVANIRWAQEANHKPGEGRLPSTAQMRSTRKARHHYTLSWSPYQPRTLAQVLASAAAKAVAILSNHTCWTSESRRWPCGSMFLFFLLNAQNKLFVFVFFNLPSTSMATTYSTRVASWI